MVSNRAGGGQGRQRRPSAPSLISAIQLGLLITAVLVATTPPAVHAVTSENTRASGGNTKEKEAEKRRVSDAGDIPPWTDLSFFPPCRPQSYLSLPCFPYPAQTHALSTLVYPPSPCLVADCLISDFPFVQRNVCDLGRFTDRFSLLVSSVLRVASTSARRLPRLLHIFVLLLFAFPRTCWFLLISDLS